MQRSSHALAAVSRIALSTRQRLGGAVVLAALAWYGPYTPTVRAAEPIPGTSPLTIEGDIASEMVEGIDRYLMRQISASAERRERHWRRDASSREAFDRSIEPNRRRLAHILGVRDARANPIELDRHWLGRAAEGRVDVSTVRWPAFGDVQGHGLLLEPRALSRGATVIAIPDADQTPEQLAGLTPGLPSEMQIARRLAESGCRVIVPAIVSRQVEARNGRAKLTHREFLYRSAFELGRHLIGYEVQQALALVDEATARGPSNADENATRVGVWGYGEGGLIALCAAALDPRIETAAVSGYFDDRSEVWKQPIDRNVFGLLDQFGDAELAAMLGGRGLLIHDAAGPQASLPGEGGAPAELVSPRHAQQEFARLRRLVGDGFLWRNVRYAPPPWNDELFRQFLELLEPKPAARPEHAPPRNPSERTPDAPAAPRSADSAAADRIAPDGLPNPERRQRTMIHELDRHNQQLLIESPFVRAEFMKQLDASSLEKYAASVEPYRQKFGDEIIGRFDEPLSPPNPRVRQVYDRPTWTGYEVVLDVWPDVIAYGVLLLPKGMRAGERRPVVVCQHGLEGRPRDTIEGDNPAYHDFAAKLAERGFIAFAPQNPYLFTDRFRSLQRKANPLGKTLFSVIVPQHQQMTDWLKSLPQVDPQRIAFYGLSYGGKSAMRIPPLVSNYCLSICSADFNEWVWKNASTRSPYSYVWTGEYEIFEFDLGSTFNYAEMAALIAPRPFMVERGHFDGVAPDEAVGYEFAKVRHLYAARLGIGERCEMETFVGPHTINGRGTFDFLHRHLAWPAPASAGP